MPRQTRSRPVNGQLPKELGFAVGITVFWALAAWGFFALPHASANTSFLTAAFFVVMSVVTPLTWYWAIKATRYRLAAGKSLEQLRLLTPDQFEEWVAARFEDLGYKVRVTGARGDHGVDLVAEKAGEEAVVQCKNWKAWKVGEPKLRDLYGAMTDFGANRAYLVTTGSVTEPARRWIHGKPIEIWDGEYLAQLSKQLVLKGNSSRGDAVVTETLVTCGSEPISASAVRASIQCPQCGSALVERQNRKTGESFLG